MEQRGRNHNYGESRTNGNKKGVKRKRKQNNQIQWIKRMKEIKIHTSPITNRGEDTTTYGEATEWLQPGTPKGDLYLELMGILNKSDTNTSFRKTNKRPIGFKLPKKK